MQLKASTDYGLRAVLYLAAKGTTCSSKDIANDMSIPRDYLIQLAQMLRNVGIIEARPGKYGGYRLAKDPAEITLLEIIDALDEETKASTRARRDYRANVPMLKNVKEAYGLILESYDAYLDSITIEMLLDCARDTEHAQEYLAGRFADESNRLAKKAQELKRAIA